MLKKYLNLVMLCCGVFLLITNCEKDTTLETELLQKSQFVIKDLNYEQVVGNAIIAQKLEKFKPKKGEHSILSREIYNEEYDFVINTDDVKYLEDTENNIHSYNFPSCSIKPRRC